MTTTYGRGPAPLVLGAYLRALRLARDLTLCDAAEVIGSSAAKLSRMETGQVAQQWQEVSTLLRFYGVTHWFTIVGALRWSGQESRDPKRGTGTIHDNAEGWADRLRACEHHASAICVYASATIPRIVQTTEYPAAQLPLLPSSTQPQDVTVILDGATLLRTFGNPQPARDRLATGLAAAKGLEVSAALLDVARRRFEQLAGDPESDPLLEELTA
ncbi:helix-turn-helix transcriptional regulator [Streptomyces sp. DASNCL29]|uniref:helix-turn-helix domain-containing protein n=1 Tax=Streptomyces sp. DASNCL29 TaxID=2583819 RepID=UPI00110FF5A3|nr:helix-turn-helix transcriptional regulator [Streptomyces sp. DASNCL29]TMU92912.1 helix-turn-helix domain-containing protein [Streptomyces sp. DASNCL29]